MSDHHGMELKQVIEALLIASQKPLPVKEIAVTLRGAAQHLKKRDPENRDPVPGKLAKAKVEQIEEIIRELQQEFEEQRRGFQLQENASGWQVVTHPETALWVRQLFPESRPARLSAPALETLAIIAYRQPITRADMEAVRGVSVDGVMQTLLDRSMVRIAGRAEIPGRPLLYETTQHFLEHFNLKSLDDLPNADELRRAPLPSAEPADEGAKEGAEEGESPEAPATPGETPSPEEATAAADHSSTEAPPPGNRCRGSNR